MIKVNYNYSNLLRIKNYVNKKKDECLIDECNLIIFNYIIDLYPNKKWLKIEDYYLQNIYDKNILWIIIYTIVVYSYGIYNFPFSYIDDLCKFLLKNKFSFYNIFKYTNFFLNSKIYNILNKGKNKKNISYYKSMTLIVNNFDLTNNEIKAYNFICKYIEDYKYNIFNRDYSFLNIYNSLINLMNIFNITFNNNINNIFDFEKLDVSLQEKIKNCFFEIEEKNIDIKEKINQFITLIQYYSYKLKENE